MQIREGNLIFTGWNEVIASDKTTDCNCGKNGVEENGVTGRLCSSLNQSGSENVFDRETELRLHLRDAASK